jgi:hypothetical protein
MFMIPRLIPILSSVLTALGLGGLWFYYLLSPEAKGRFDKLANEYAQQLYNKNLDGLTRQQISDTYNLVRRHFGS